MVLPVRNVWQAQCQYLISSSSCSVGEMSHRNTKIQEGVSNRSDQLNTSVVQHTVQIKVEAPEDQSPGVDQQDPEPLHNKEEELWDSLEEEEQLNVIVVFPLKSEDDEEKPLISQLHLNSDQRNRSDVQHTVQIKEECPEDQSPGVDQQDPEPLHIKEEELWDSLEEEQLNVIVVFPLKSEDDEEKPLISQLHQHQMEDREVPTSSSADQMKVEADGEDCGGAETSRSTDLNPHGDTSSSSETEVSEDEEADEDENSHDSHLKPLLDSGSTNEGRDINWKKSRASESGGNSVNKLFSCDDCSKVFNSKTKLIRHMRVHTGEKPFKCDICEQSFNQKTNLNIHTRVHTGEKPFVCALCGLKFIQKSNLNTHMNVHTGKKPFDCDACGQKFSHRTNLNRHKKIHTGQKPFECDVCGQRFGQKTNLNTHMSVHTGQKPFACELCGQRFIQKSDLNKHTRIHTGQKPFVCLVCELKFRQKSNLNKHMRNHHGGETAVNTEAGTKKAGEFTLK